jgi:hypothetical protein
MKKIHCDGCPFVEPENAPKDKRQIGRVKLMIIEDPRFPEGATHYEADLCKTCKGQVLHKYFDIPAQGKLELPAFIEPVRSMRADAGT